MSVTWTLKDASGANLTHQPASGSPLALQYDTNGYTHLSGYASEIIYSCEAEADTSSVTITLSPDTSGDTLSESLSSPTKDPTTHGGSLTWTNLSAGVTTLVFTVPSSTGTVWGWDCLAEHAIGLKSKYKLKRGGL